MLHKVCIIYIIITEADLSERRQTRFVGNAFMPEEALFRIVTPRKKEASFSFNYFHYHCKNDRRPP